MKLNDFQFIFVSMFFIFLSEYTSNEKHIVAIIKKTIIKSTLKNVKKLVAI